jgi:serine/threonine protein kinase
MSVPRAEVRPSCPDALILHQWVHDELAQEEAASIEEHVGACPSCQQALDRLGEGLSGLLFPLLGKRGEPEDEEPPSLNGYELLGRIDAGGMGVVWRVRDLQFQRTLAVKVMKARPCGDPNAVRRFLAEAQVTGQLAHPFIVPIHAMGRLADNRPYYTMKLVEGETLAALLRRRPDPASRRMELVQVFSQVCQAVAFAHSRGIIHRDLKPANVMVGAHGEVQVMDWGLAKVLAGTAAPRAEAAAGNETVEAAGYETGEHTRTGSVLGTWAYMPPEQARGQVSEVDQRSDVFGLGAILCEVLIGTPPYTGPDARAVRLEATEARLDGALSRLRNCDADPALIQLAERCLAPRKSDRPGNAGEVAAAVAAYQAAVQERLQQERLERERQQVKAAEERRRRKLWTGLAAAVVTVMVLGLRIVVPASRDWYQRRQINAWLDWAKGEHNLPDASWSQMQNGKYKIIFNGPLTGGGGGGGGSRGSRGDPNDEGRGGDKVIQAVLDRAVEAGLVDLIGGLDLSRCNLTKVPQNINRFPKLELLNLSRNSDLEEVPPQIGDLTELTELDLGQAQKLEKLPKEIGRLNKLKKLHAPRANLTTLPREIEGLKNLISLHLSNNPLQALPTEIGELTSLVELYAENTELQTVPDQIGRLHSLMTLRLGNNPKLKSLPNSILDLKGLKHIDVPAGFRKLQPAYVAQLEARFRVHESRGGGKGPGSGGGGGQGRGGGGGKRDRPDRDSDR